MRPWERDQVVATGLVTVLSREQDQVLPTRAYRVAIGPTCVARLERAVVPAQNLERGGFADPTTTDGVDDLTATKIQIADLGTGADAHHSFAAGQALHLH